MDFEPENALEKAMLLAVTQESARPEFYRLLMESELLALGTADLNQNDDTVEGSLSLEMVEGPDGRRYHPVFTSERRLRDFAKASGMPGTVKVFSLEGRALFSCTHGAHFVVNPGSSVNKPLVPEEIAFALGQRRRTRQRGFTIVPPPEHPKKLIQALSVLFTSRTRVKSARLVYAEQGDKPFPLIGIETDGDMQVLSKEIFAAAATAMPDARIDILHLDPIPQNEPVRRRFANVSPFYVRTIPFPLN